MEEITNLLYETLKKSLELASKTGQFVIEAAPELLRQFYTWHLSYNIMMIMSGILIILIFRYGPVYLMVEAEDDDYNVDSFYGKYYKGDLPVIATAVSIVFTFVGVITILIALFSIVKLIVAPELYLIDHMLHLTH